MNTYKHAKKGTMPWKTAICLIALVTTVVAHAQTTHLELSKGKIKLQFSLDQQGAPQYAVWFNEQEVIKNSSLGFLLDTDSLFYKNFSLFEMKRRSVNETW